jgi:HAD superfamily hydrolase (TIGR01549 family)
MDPPQETIFLRVCQELEIGLDESLLASSVRRANELLGPRTPASDRLPFSQERVDRFWTEYHSRVLDGCATAPRASTRAPAVYRRFNEVLGWRVYDDVRPLLDSLRSRGICVGVISNWTGDLEDVLRRVDLHARFDIVMDSARFGHEKPHAEIFREALRRAGTQPHRALHVGDSIEHDVDGALGSGLRAALLDREDRHRTFDRAPRVRRLDGVLELL